MRIGKNPNYKITIEASEYIHQIIIPVYIPNEDGYFKDAYRIFKICLESLFSTAHKKTFITIVNNGSCKKVVGYLDSLFLEKKINELIHTDNIGKINAVFKGLAGNNIELVTISDSDVMFLPHWQYETVNIFKTIPKAGVVGITPQFKLYESKCGNVIFDNLFSNKLKFIPVKNKKALIHFYDSIGWDRNYNQDYLKFGLGLEFDNLKCFVGSGHYVATYRKDIFEELYTFIGGKKVAGIGEDYIDKKSLAKDYWRLTTHDNYAFHMGNVHEEWMDTVELSKTDEIIELSLRPRKKISSFCFFIKNKLFVKFLSIKWMVKLFLKWKGLPKQMRNNY